MHPPSIHGLRPEDEQKHRDTHLLSWLHRQLDGRARGSNHRRAGQRCTCWWQERGSLGGHTLRHCHHHRGQGTGELRHELGSGRRPHIRQRWRQDCSRRHRHSGDRGGVYGVRRRVAQQDLEAQGCRLGVQSGAYPFAQGNPQEELGAAPLQYACQLQVSPSLRAHSAHRYCRST